MLLFPRWNSYTVQLYSPKKGQQKGFATSHTPAALLQPPSTPAGIPNLTHSVAPAHKAAKTSEQLMKLRVCVWGEHPFSCLLRSQQEFNNLPGQKAKSPHKAQHFAAFPQCCEAEAEPKGCEHHHFIGRGSSHGERPLLEPWQHKEAPQGARGSRHRSPHSTTASLLLLQPRETLHPLGKARRDTQGMQEPSQSHC